MKEYRIIKKGNVYTSQWKVNNKWADMPGRSSFLSVGKAENMIQNYIDNDIKMEDIPKEYEVIKTFKFKKPKKD